MSTSVILWISKTESPTEVGGVIEHIDGYLEATLGEKMLARVDQHAGGDAKQFTGYVFSFVSEVLDVDAFLRVIHDAPWKHQGTSTMMIHVEGWDAPSVYIPGDPIPLRQA